jgi:hypothetical protein
MVGTRIMLKLPFHVASPLVMGFAALAASLAMLYLTWAYDRETLVGKVLKWYFERRLRALDRERAHKWGRTVLRLLAAIFAVFALFGIVVGSGLIQNGDPPRTLTMDEFLKEHSK